MMDNAGQMMALMTMTRAQPWENAVRERRLRRTVVTQFWVMNIALSMMSDAATVKKRAKKTSSGTAEAWTNLVARSTETRSATARR